MRLLRAGEERALERFLAAHSDSSLLMLSNLQAAGLEDRGARYQGSYAACFHGRAIAAAAAHYGNGMLLLQAPVSAARLAALAMAASGRPVKGLLGPSDQVAALRRELRLQDQACELDTEEDLMALDLFALQVPQALQGGDLRVRLARSSELDLLANWRVTFAEEALGARNGPELRAQAREEVARWQAAKANLVLAYQGRLVASCAVIGGYGPSLQLGAVWTPPALRGRGFARCLVAGALQRGRDNGKTRAVLITSNPAARRAYLKVGFRKAGEQSLVIFGEPLELTLPRPSLLLRQPSIREAELAKSRGAA